MTGQKTKLTKMLNKYKNILNIAIVVCVVAFLIGVAWLAKGFKQAREDVARLQGNQVVLLSEIDRYKVADSLSAVQTTALRLTLNEYMSLYSSECEQVRRLKSDIKGLQSVVNTQTETINELKAAVKPVVVVHDTIMAVIDTLQCFNYSDKWIDVDGCIEDDSVSLSVTSRDELLAVESLQRKRFLGIPLPISWFGYRSRTVDVVSSNPNTVIKNVTYKTIEQ